MDNIYYSDELESEVEFLPYSGEDSFFIDDIDFYSNIYGALPKEDKVKLYGISNNNVVFRGSGITSSAKEWMSVMEPKYYQRKQQSLLPQEQTLPEFGKRNYISYMPYFSKDGNIKFRPIIAEINDDDIIKKGWDGVPIELSFNTANNELNYSNYFVYQDLIRKQVSKLKKYPLQYKLYNDIINSLLKKEWLLGDIKSLNDVGFTSEEKDKINELRGIDKELDQYVISQARTIYKLKRDAQAEYANRIGKKRLYSIDEISRMPYEYQLEEVKNYILSQMKTSEDGKYLEIDNEQLKHVIKNLKEIRRKSNTLRREDTLNRMSFLGKLLFGYPSHLLSSIKDTISDIPLGDVKSLPQFLYLTTGLEIAESTIDVLNWIPEHIAFNIDHPIEEYIKTFENYVNAVSTLKGTKSGKLRILNPDTMGIGESEKKEIDRMKSDFLGGLASEALDVISEKGLSTIFLASSISAGVSLGSKAGPVGAAIGGVIGSVVGLIGYKSGIGGLQSLKRHYMGIEGYIDNFANDEILAIGRLMFPKITDDEYKKLVEEMPESKAKIDALRQLGNMYSDDIFTDYNRVGSIVGTLLGDIVTNYTAYNTLLKGKDYLRRTLLEINAAPQAWRHLPLLSKFNDIKIAERVLDWAAKMPNERFVINPNMRPAYKFLKRALKMSDEGIKTWAIAEMVRHNPYTDFDDILLSGATGALFNLWSLSVGSGLRAIFKDKWLEKSVAELEGKVNDLLKKVNEKGITLDKILRDSGRSDIVDIHKLMDDAILDKYILLGDLLIANVAQTATLRLLEDGYSGLEKYFGSSELLGDLIGGLFLGAKLGYGRYKTYNDLKTRYKSMEKHLLDAIDKTSKDANYINLINHINNVKVSNDDDINKIKVEANNKRDIVNDILGISEESIAQKPDDVVDDIVFGNFKKEIDELIKEAKDYDSSIGGKGILQDDKIDEFNFTDYDIISKETLDRMNDFIIADSGGNVDVRIFDRDIDGIDRDNLIGDVSKAAKVAKEYLDNNGIDTSRIFAYKIGNDKKVVPIFMNNGIRDTFKLLYENKVYEKEGVNNDIIISDKKGNLYVINKVSIDDLVDTGKQELNIGKINLTYTLFDDDDKQFTKDNDNIDSVKDAVDNVRSKVKNDDNLKGVIDEISEAIGDVADRIKGKGISGSEVGKSVEVSGTDKRVGIIDESDKLMSELLSSLDVLVGKKTDKIVTVRDDYVTEREDNDVINETGNVEGDTVREGNELVKTWIDRLLEVSDEDDIIKKVDNILESEKAGERSDITDLRGEVAEDNVIDEGDIVADESVSDIVRVVDESTVDDSGLIEEVRRLVKEEAIDILNEEGYDSDVIKADKLIDSLSKALSEDDGKREELRIESSEDLDNAIIDKVESEIKKEKTKVGFYKRVLKELGDRITEEDKVKIKKVIRDSVSEEGNEFITEASKVEVLNILRDAINSIIVEEVANSAKSEYQNANSVKDAINENIKAKENNNIREHVEYRKAYDILVSYFITSMASEEIFRRYGLDPSIIRFTNNHTLRSMIDAPWMYVEYEMDNALNYTRLVLNIILDGTRGFDQIMKDVPHEVWHIYKQNVIDRKGNEKLKREYDRVYNEIYNRYESTKNLYERSKALYYRKLWSDLVSSAKSIGDVELYDRIYAYKLDSKIDYRKYDSDYKAFEEDLKSYNSELINLVEEYAKDEVMAEIFRLSENARYELGIESDFMKLKDKLVLYTKEAFGKFTNKDGGENLQKMYLDFMSVMNDFKIFRNSNIRKISKDYRTYFPYLSEVAKLGNSQYISIYTSLLRGIKDIKDFSGKINEDIVSKFKKLWDIQSQLEGMLKLNTDLNVVYDNIGSAFSLVPELKITSKYDLIEYLNKKYSNGKYSDYVKEFSEILSSKWESIRKLLGNIDLDDFLKIAWIKYGPGTYEDNYVTSILVNDDGGKVSIRVKTSKANPGSTIFDLDVNYQDTKGTVFSASLSEGKGIEEEAGEVKLGDETLKKVRKGKFNKTTRSIGNVYSAPPLRKKRVGWEIAKSVLGRVYSGSGKELSLLIDSIRNSNIVKLASILTVKKTDNPIYNSDYDIDNFVNSQTGNESKVSTSYDYALRSQINTYYSIDREVLENYGDDIFKTLAANGIFTTLASDKAYYFIDASNFMKELLEKYRIKIIDGVIVSDNVKDGLATINDAILGIMGVGTNDGMSLIDFIGNIEADIATKVMQSSSMLNRWGLKYGWDNIGKDRYISIFDIYNLRSVNSKWVMLPKEGLDKELANSIDKNKLEHVVDIVNKHLDEYKNLTTPIVELTFKDTNKKHYELFKELIDSDFAKSDDYKNKLLKSFSEVFLRKLIGIFDTLVMTSIDPSMSFMWHTYKLGDKVVSNKYIYKYSTYSHYDHQVLSLDKLEELLKEAGVINNNNNIVGKGVVIGKDPDGKDELHANVYIFDPDSWSKYANELEQLGMNDAAIAVRGLVDILGEKALDGGTISINKEYSDGLEVHNILGLLGGTIDRGSYKTRAMITDGINSSPWKHAIHPEYIGNTNERALTPGQVMYRMLLKALHKNNICILTVPSAIKGNGVFRPRIHESIDGNKYLISHTNKKLGILRDDGRAEDLGEGIRPYEVIEELGRIYQEYINEGKKDELYKQVSLRDDDITNNIDIFKGKDKELFSIKVPLTGKYGMSWDSQKGDPHDKSSSIPFRYYDFSIDSPINNSVSKLFSKLKPFEQKALNDLGIRRISDIINFIAVKNKNKIEESLSGFNSLVRIVSAIVSNKSVQFDVDDKDINGIWNLLMKLNKSLSMNNDPDDLAGDNLFNEYDDDVLISKLLDSSLFRHNWIRESKILDRILKKDSDKYLDIRQEADKVEFIKRLPLLFIMSDSIMHNEKDVANILNKTNLLWNIVQKDLYDNIMFRHKGCISVLDSDRHAIDDFHRLIEYEKNRNRIFVLPQIEDGYNELIDTNTGAYKDYSIGISVSLDILEKFNLRMGTPVFVILTPSDSGQSLVPLRVTGLLSPEKRNTITFNRAMQIDILGRDHDIDTMGLLVPSNEWIINYRDDVTGKINSVNLFNLLHKFLVFNGFHKGELKKKIVDIRNRAKKEYKPISIKYYGMKNAVDVYINNYDIIDDPDFKNSYRYEDEQILSPLNIDTPLHSRKYFSNKKIGLYAYYYNIHSQLANVIDSNSYIRVTDNSYDGNGFNNTMNKILDYISREYGRDVSEYLKSKYRLDIGGDLMNTKFKFDIDYGKYSVLVSFMKEGSVDVFNKHPYKLEIGETLAEFSLRDIHIFGKHYDRIVNIMEDKELSDMDKLAMKAVLGALMKHLLDAYGNSYNPIRYAKRSVIANLKLDGLEDSLHIKKGALSNILDIPIRNNNIYGNSIDGILAKGIKGAISGVSNYIMNFIKEYNYEMRKVSRYYLDRRLNESGMMEKVLADRLKEKYAIDFDKLMKDISYSIEHGLMILNAITSRSLPGRHIHSFMPFWLNNIVPIHRILGNDKLSLIEAIDISIASESVLDGIMDYILNSREALQDELNVQQKVYDDSKNGYKYIFDGSSLEALYPVSFRKMPGGSTKDTNRYNTFDKMYGLRLWLWVRDDGEIMVRYDYDGEVGDISIKEFINKFSELDIVKGSYEKQGIVEKLVGEYLNIETIKKKVQSAINSTKWSKIDYSLIDLEGNLDISRKVGKEYIISNDKVKITSKALDALINLMDKNYLVTYTDDGRSVRVSAIMDSLGYYLEGDIKDKKLVNLRIRSNNYDAKRKIFEDMLIRKLKSMVYDGFINNSIELEYRYNDYYGGQLLNIELDSVNRDKIHAGLGGLFPYITGYESRRAYALSIMTNYIIRTARLYSDIPNMDEVSRKQLMGLIVGKFLDYVPDYSLLVSSLPSAPGEKTSYSGLYVGPNKGVSNVLRGLREYIFKSNKSDKLEESIIEEKELSNNKNLVDPNLMFNELESKVLKFIDFAKNNGYNNLAEELDAYISSLRKDREVTNSFSLPKILHETKYLYNKLYDAINSMELSLTEKYRLHDSLMEFGDTGDKLIKSMVIALNIPLRYQSIKSTMFGISHNLESGLSKLASSGLIYRPFDLIDTGRPIGLSWVGRELNEVIRSKGITPYVLSPDSTIKDYDIKLAEILIDYYNDKKLGLNIRKVTYVSSGNEILREVSSRSGRISSLLGKLSNILTGGIGNVINKLYNYNTFEESFNKFVKGHYWSDGTPIDFNNFFGGAKRLINEEDKEIAKKVVHDFAYQELSNILGIEGLEKSELKDEFFILTKEYKPEDYINLITQLKVKQLSRYYSLIIDEIRDLSPGVLKNYMNEAAVTVFNIHREVMEAVKKRKRFAKNVLLDRTQSIEKLIKELALDEMNTPFALAEKLSSQKILVKPSDKILEIPVYTVDDNGNLVEDINNTILITASMIKEGRIFPEYSAKVVLETKGSYDVMPYLEVSPSEIALSLNSIIRQEIMNNGVNDDLYIDYIRMKDDRIKSLGLMDKSIKYDRMMDKVMSNKVIKLEFRYEDVGGKIVPFVYLYRSDGNKYIFSGTKASINKINDISNFVEEVYNILKKETGILKNFDFNNLSRNEEESFKLTLEKNIVMNLYNLNKGYQIKKWQSLSKSMLDIINFDSLNNTKVEWLLAKGKLVNDLFNELYVKMTNRSGKGFYFYNANNASTLLSLMQGAFIEVDKFISSNGNYRSDKAIKFLMLYYDRFVRKDSNDSKNVALSKAIKSYIGLRNRLQLKSIAEKDYSVSDVISRLSMLFGENIDYVKWNLFINDLIREGIIKKSSVPSDVFSQYNDTINRIINGNVIDILESKYINDVIDVKIRTGFDENSLVMDEVLYALASNRDSDIIYNRDITGDIISGNSEGIYPISIYTKSKVILKGIYLGNVSGIDGMNIMLLNSSGRIVSVNTDDVSKVYAGDTYKQSIRMLLDEMARVLKTNLPSNILEEYNSYKGGGNDAQLRMLKISNEVTRELAKGEYTISDIVKHAPNVTVALQYLNYGKLLRSALGIGGAIVSAFYNPALSLTMLGYSAKGLIGFGIGIMRKVLQNVFSNYRGLYEIEGFRNTIEAIASTLKHRESDVILDNQDAVQTFYKQEVGSSYKLGLSNRKIDDLIRIMEEGNEMMRTELQRELVEDAYYSLIEGKFTASDLAKVIGRVRNELLRRHSGGDIDADILNYIDSMKYNVYTKEFFTEYGDNVASLMQLRRNFFEQILDAAEKFTRVIPLSEELTRSLAQQSISHLVTSKEMGSYYTKEEKKKIIYEWINMSGGQYGKSTRTSFGNSELGRFMTMYGRFNKNNSVFYLNDVWRRIEEQKLLDRLEELAPDIFGKVGDKYARISSAAISNDKLIANISFETDFKNSVNRKLAFGSAVAFTSMIGKIGIMYLLYLLFGKYFTNLISGSDESVEYIESMTGIGQIYGSGLQLLIGGGVLGMLVADTGIDNSVMTDKQIVNMYRRAIESPSEFLFATGLGSGFSNLGGLLAGTAVNMGLYVLRSRSPQVSEVLGDEIKGAMYDMIKNVSSSIPYVAPLGITYKEATRMYNKLQEDQ